MTAPLTGLLPIRAQVRAAVERAIRFEGRNVSYAELDGMAWALADELRLAGQLALLGSSLAYAVGNVYARRNVRGLPPMIPAVFQVTFALIIVSVIALVFERPWETARPDLEAWFSVIWLGILGSGMAYLAYFRLLSRWGATRTSLVAYLLPIVGIVLGFLVLQEPLNVTLLAGTALVIAGVALVNGRWGRRPLFTPAAEGA